MPGESPENMILAIGGAFLLGWLLSAISARLNDRFRARKRDPRDNRIRELEAELRIARSEAESSSSKLDRVNDELKETVVGMERRDYVITDQQSKIERISADLKESILKTRELRSELANRAAENVHAEAKIREVETELSVAQASTDLLATGVLDYAFDSESEVPSDDADITEQSVEKVRSSAG